MIFARSKRRCPRSLRSGSAFAAERSATRPAPSWQPGAALELITDKSSAAGVDGASAEVGVDELTIYDNLRRDDSIAWKDLCRGLHVPHTGYIPAFALTGTRRRTGR